MKNKIVQKKWDKDLVVCVGTDIPPMSTVELMIFCRLRELRDEKNTNILAMNDIFDGYTHTKYSRFELLSRLVKRKIIQRIRISNDYHEYLFIPKNSFRDSKEMRIYRPTSRKERFNIIRKFTMN